MIFFCWDGGPEDEMISVVFGENPGRWQFRGCIKSADQFMNSPWDTVGYLTPCFGEFDGESLFRDDTMDYVWIVCPD